MSYIVRGRDFFLLRFVFLSKREPNPESDAKFCFYTDCMYRQLFLNKSLFILFYFLNKISKNFIKKLNCFYLKKNNCQDHFYENTGKPRFESPHQISMFGAGTTCIDRTCIWCFSHGPKWANFWWILLLFLRYYLKAEPQWYFNI